jgi:hypothetical protein
MPNPVHCIIHIIQQYLNFSNLLSVDTNEKSNVSFNSTSRVIISKFHYYFSDITFVSLRCRWNHCRFSAYPRQQLSENLIRRITSNNFFDMLTFYSYVQIYTCHPLSRKSFSLWLKVGVAFIPRRGHPLLWITGTIDGTKWIKKM